MEWSCRCCVWELEGQWEIKGSSQMTRKRTLSLDYCVAITKTLSGRYKRDAAVPDDCVNGGNGHDLNKS